MKKTGTEKFIPEIKNGFIKTMKEKYNVSEEESEELIKDFLQVIIDASSYLFSKNHSDPYSFLGYAVAWLRYYYPLETLTTALNIYAEDKEKSINIINYVNKCGIKINPIKFGKSNADYTMDKLNNAIYKGISSIKFCNNKIAEELMELSKNKYDSFIDLLDDIFLKTSIDIKQLNILTGLNFFSDFGCNKKLLEIIKLYNGVKQKTENSKSAKTLLPSLRNCNEIKKEKIESYSEYGISEFIIKKYSGKETAKKYSEIDNLGLLKELCNNIPDKSMSVMEYVKFEIEFLEYTTYVNKNMPSGYYIVIDFKTYKDKTKPYVVLRELKTGEEIKTRIKNSKTFCCNPFNKFNILKVSGFTWDYKKKNIDGKWQSTDEQEPILDNYVLIK